MTIYMDDTLTAEEIADANEEMRTQRAASTTREEDPR